MTDEPGTFEEALREQTQIKNIPNSEFNDDTFEFADYFDTEAFRESVDEDIDDVEDWVDWAFEPYSAFSEVPEIEAEREEEDEIYWMNVTVEVPTDPDRAARLAAVVSNAIEQRRQR